MARILCWTAMVVAWPFAVAQEDVDKLAVLKPLVGHTYVGTFPNGNMTDVHSFEWVFEDKFIRNKHEVRNADGQTVYAGEAIYAWDPKTESLVFWYWNTTGGFVEGAVAEENGKLMANGENHGQKGQVAKVRSALWDIGSDSYKATSYFWKDGAWQEQWTMTFKRQDNP